LKRSVGVLFAAATAFLSALFIWRVAQGDRSWVIGLLGAFLLMIISLVAAVYVVHYRYGIAALRAMNPPEAILTLDESTFSMASSLGSSTLPWSAVTELWRFDRIWLLLFSKSQFVTLPVRCVGPEAQSYITEKVRSVGARVA
jgi:hypothetical protein